MTWVRMDCLSRIVVVSFIIIVTVTVSRGCHKQTRETAYRITQRLVTVIATTRAVCMDTALVRQYVAGPARIYNFCPVLFGESNGRNYFPGGQLCFQRHYFCLRRNANHTLSIIHRRSDRTGNMSAVTAAGR